MRIPRPGADAGTSKLIPACEHVAYVTEIDDTPSSAGTEMLTLTLELREKINGKRRTLRAWVPFSNSQRLEELYDSFPNAVDGDGFLNSEDLIGAICVIDVIHEKYKNKMTDKVDTIQPYKPEEDDQAVEDEREYEAAHQDQEGDDDDDCPF